MIQLIKYCCLFLLFFLKFNPAKAIDYKIGAETRNVSTLNNNDSVTFTSNSSKLIINADKTLSAISSALDLEGGTIDFNSPGKNLIINNSIGSSGKITKEIIFNADATLSIKDDIYSQKITIANFNEAGTINLNGVGTVQNVSAAIGNSENRLRNIIVTNLGTTGTRLGENVFVKNFNTSGITNIAANKTIDVSGELNGAGRIKGNSTEVGRLTLSGTAPQIVNVEIGQSPTIRLGEVFINNQSDEGAIFNNNIFAAKFNVNGKTTITGNATRELGIVTVADGKELTFLSNNTTINILENSGTINIPAGKILNIAKDTTLSGKFNIGVDYDSSSLTSGQIKALNDVDIGDNLELFFNFSNSNQKEDENLYPILTVDLGKKLTVASLDQIKVSDNSILMNVSLQLNNNQILAFNGISKTALDMLDSRDSRNAQRIMKIDSKEQSAMKLVQNQLRKINDLPTLKKSLKTLNAPSNNMVESTSTHLIHRANDVIISHILTPINNKNSGFSSGNNSSEKYIWGQAFEGEASQNSREGQDGYDSNISGLVFGSDVTINHDNINYLFGLAVTYAKADIDSNSDNKSDVNSFGLSLYNLNDWNGGFYNNNLLNLAYNKYNQRREIAVGTFKAEAKSKFHGVQYGAATGFGYNLKMSEFLTISPNITIKYSRLNQSSYEEQGAGDVGLKIKNQPFDNLSSEIGSKFTYHHILDKNYSAIPVLNLAWIRNLKTNGQQSTSSFIAGGDEVNNKGVGLARDVFNIGFEMSLMQTKENTNLTFKYDIQKGSGFKSETTYLKYLMPF